MFSRKEQFIFVGAAIIFTVTMVIYVASFIDKKTVLLPAMGGTYREGMLTQPVYINPVISNGNEADKDIIALTYSTVADLAEKITVADNNQVWTVRIKDNVYWHDGTRLTADDIVFTIQSIQNPEANSPLSAAWQGVTPERVSELELTLTTGAPYAFFDENLKSFYVVPKHIFSQVPVANWRQSDYNLEPIGSGPYKVASFKKEKNGFISEYYLVKNDRYFKEKPFINNITFIFFANPDDELEAFNIARIDALSGINPLLVKNIKRPHKIVDLRLPRYYAVFLNQNSNDLLKNRAVRLALDYATDKKDIIKNVFFGSASLIDEPTPYMPQATSSDPTSYDPGEAMKILDASKLRKGTDGFFGEIKLVIPQIEFLTKTAGILKSNWEAIGIKTTLITLDIPTISNEVIKNRNYDAILFGNAFATNPDMFSFWHSSERFYPGLNLSLYNNKDADKLIESVRKDFDSSSRAKKLADFTALIRADTPAVFLYSPNYLYLMNNNIRGFNEAIINTPSSRFHDVTSWYIKTKRVFR
ncbi:MAG TPA: peptide ABC transporter substrate-binding protein [Candidatus Paceibacterota bacterium]